MPFRDDREALIARVDALEQQLAETREEAEEERARLNEEKERLVKQRDRAVREAEAAKRGDTLPPEVSSSVAEPTEGHVGAAETTKTSFLSEVGDWLFLPFGLIWMWWDDTSTLVRVLVVLAVLAIIGGVLYTSILAAGLDRQATVTWAATVSSARGVELQPGDECVVEASLRGNGEEDFTVDSLVITCGSEQLYRWSDPVHELPGDDDPSPIRGCSELGQRAVAEGTTYTIRCSDTGGRTGGRPELGLDTPTGTALVWRDTPPMLRVELDVAHSSHSVSGRPLLGVEHGQPAWYD